MTRETSSAEGSSITPEAACDKQGCDKRDQRARLVCFTVFDMAYDFSLLTDRLQYIAYGREVCPTTSREHYQAFGYSKVAQRWTWWNKLLSPWHFEICKGTLDQNEKYCRKDGVYTELGVKPMGDGKRRDLAEVCDAIVKKRKLIDVALENPQVYVQYHNGLTSLACMVDSLEPYCHPTTRGVWIYGPSGAGKSHHARNAYSDVYIKTMDLWFDGYSGQETIVFEDVDNGMMGYHLKIWMDKWPCKGNIKGKPAVQLRHHRFVVTSQYTIEELFTDPKVAQAITRRCELIHLDSVYK